MHGPGNPAAVRETPTLLRPAAAAARAQPSLKEAFDERWRIKACLSWGRVTTKLEVDYPPRMRALRSRESTLLKTTSKRGSIVRQRVRVSVRALVLEGMHAPVGKSARDLFVDAPQRRHFLFLLFVFPPVWSWFSVPPVLKPVKWPCAEKVQGKLIAVNARKVSR